MFRASVTRALLGFGFLARPQLFSSPSCRQAACMIMQDGGSEHPRGELLRGDNPDSILNLYNVFGRVWARHSTSLRYLSTVLGPFMARLSALTSRSAPNAPISKDSIVLPASCVDKRLQFDV